MFSFGISCMEVTLVPLKVEFHFFFQLKDNFEMSFWLIKSGSQLPRTLFFFPSPNHRITGRAVSAGARSPPPGCVRGPHSLHLVVLSPIRRQGRLSAARSGPPAARLSCAPSFWLLRRFHGSHAHQTLAGQCI